MVLFYRGYGITPFFIGFMHYTQWGDPIIIFMGEWLLSIFKLYLFVYI